MDQNANKTQAPVAKAAATATVPYGTEHIGKILDVGVAVVAAVKDLKKEDTTMQKVTKFLPAVIAAAGAVESFSKAGPEFKDLDASEIESLRNTYLPKFGVDGKVGIYAAEGLNIIISGYKILKAK